MYATHWLVVCPVAGCIGTHCQFVPSAMNRRNVFAFDTEIGADCPFMSWEDVVAMLSALPAVLRNTTICAPLFPDAVASGSVTVKAPPLVLHG